jgi:hypothetical protein
MRRTEVVPTAEARADFLGYVRGFREDPNADPVVVGAHRRPEAVMLSYQAYLALLERVEDAEIRDLVTERTSAADGSRLSAEEVFEAAGIADLLTPELAE